MRPLLTRTPPALSPGSPSPPSPPAVGKGGAGQGPPVPQRGSPKRKSQSITRAVCTVVMKGLEIKGKPRLSSEGGPRSHRRPGRTGPAAGRPGQGLRGHPGCAPGPGASVAGRGAGSVHVLPSPPARWSSEAGADQYSRQAPGQLQTAPGCGSARRRPTQGPGSSRGQASPLRAPPPASPRSSQPIGSTGAPGPHGVSFRAFPGQQAQHSHAFV